MTTLNHDRARVDYCSWARRVLKHVIDYAKETKYNGQLLSQNPVVRHKLSEIAIEVEIALLMVYNIAWMRDNGLPVDYYLYLIPSSSAPRCYSGPPMWECRSWA